MSVTDLDVTPKPEKAAQRSRRETRRRLVVAGTDLFAQHGLHGATSAQIARKAGVAAGTFYLHFKDKQELFREIAFDALRELRERQDQAASRVAGDPQAELRARYHELLQVASEKHSLIRVLFGRGHQAAELGEDVAGLAEEVLDSFLPSIEERLREGGASLHPAVAAQALVAMVSRVMAWWVEDPGRASQDEVVETLIQLHPAGPGFAGARKEP
jgi:AcrR family transcriptional regulator